MYDEITIAADDIAGAAEGEDDVVRIWAAASVAHRLGLDVILSANPDPVEAIVETGEVWADTVAELLEDEPHRRADTLRAAHAVIERLLEGVAGRRRVHPLDPRTTSARDWALTKPGPGT